MLNEEITQKYINELNAVRNQRLDDVTEPVNLTQVIADAMNALEVAYLVIRNESARLSEAPQGFVPLSQRKPTE